MSATGDAADAAIAEIRRGYRAAEESVYGSTESTLDLFGLGSSSYQAISKNLADLKPRIDTWAYKLRGWADAGVRDDGTTYAFPEWFAHGRDLASAIARYSGEAIDSSRFAAAGLAAVATVEDVGTAAVAVVNVTAWPLWVKLAAAAAVLGVVLIVARPYIPSRRK